MHVSRYVLLYFRLEVVAMVILGMKEHPVDTSNITLSQLLTQIMVFT